MFGMSTSLRYVYPSLYQLVQSLKVSVMGSVYRSKYPKGFSLFYLFIESSLTEL